MKYNHKLYTGSMNPSTMKRTKIGYDNASGQHIQFYTYSFVPILPLSGGEFQYMKLLDTHGIEFNTADYLIAMKVDIGQYWNETINQSVTLDQVIKDKDPLGLRRGIQFSTPTQAYYMYDLNEDPFDTFVPEHITDITDGFIPGTPFVPSGKQFMPLPMHANIGSSNGSTNAWILESIEDAAPEETYMLLKLYNPFYLSEATHWSGFYRAILYPVPKPLPSK